MASIDAIVPINRDDINKVLSNDLIHQVIKSSKWWPAYFSFYPYKWHNLGKPWHMIQTGEMADKILKEVHAIYAALSESGYFTVSVLVIIRLYRK